VLAGALADLIGVPETVALAGVSLLGLAAVVMRRNRAVDRNPETRADWCPELPQSS
jgi:hypothetical protein